MTNSHNTNIQTQNNIIINDYGKENKDHITDAFLLNAIVRIAPAV